MTDTAGIIDPGPGEQLGVWDCAPTMPDAPPGPLHAGEGLSGPSAADVVVNLSGPRKGTR